MAVSSAASERVGRPLVSSVQLFNSSSHDRQPDRAREACTASRGSRSSAAVGLGAAPSVGSRDDAYDNATAEAWVATFKTELVDGRRFSGYEHAEHEILHWIGFYNDERLHEKLGDFAARRIRGVEYQDRQRPNPGCQIRASTKPRALQEIERRRSWRPPSCPGS
jgi:hypothetical protein